MKPTFTPKPGFQLALILVSAFLLRLININQPYIDASGWRECSTAMMAENFFKGNWNIFYPQVNWTGPGPSYQGREFQTVTYISALLYTVFGQHDWIGRLVSVLFGVWGVFALYRLVALVWDRKHALVAAVLMAVLPFAVYIDRSFLPDPAMTSLVITSFWTWTAYLHTNRFGYLLLALFTGSLGFLTKLTGMLMLLPMAYYAVAFLYQHQRLRFRTLLPLALWGLLMIAPVIPYYIWARHLSHTYPPYHFAGSGNWLWDLGLPHTLEQKFYLGTLFKKFIPTLWGVPAIMLALVGLVWSFTASSAKPLYKNKGNLFCTTRVFHVYLAGLLLFYFIGSKELYWNFWNFHIFTPCIVIFAARGILVLAAWGSVTLQTRAIRAVAIICLLQINGYLLRHHLYHFEMNTTNYKMGKALSALKKPGDLVVTIAHDISSPVAIFYSQAKGWVFPPTENNMPPGYLPNASECICLLDELRQKGAGWFAIAANHFKYIQHHRPEFAQHLKANHQLQKETNNYVIYKLQPAIQ